MSYVDDKDSLDLMMGCFSLFHIYLLSFSLTTLFLQLSELESVINKFHKQADVSWHFWVVVLVGTGFRIKCGLPDLANKESESPVKLNFK
jgi:hypothetical protein